MWTLKLRRSFGVFDALEGSESSNPIVEFADAAQDVMAAFGALRASQLDSAKTVFGEARQLFQQGKQDEGYGKYREIVEKYYASPLYRSVKRWLAERK